MHDFDYDVMQKKRIASGAAHRKRGAKSKKCTLPHDNLTQKELRALSGEVKTYNIHQRLFWQQFKELPDDLAAEHIKYLADTFGANQSAIAEALGVCTATVRRYIQENGIKLKMRRFAPTSEWWKFLLCHDEPVEENTVDEEPVPIVAVKHAVAEPKMMAPAPAVAAPPRMETAVDLLPKKAPASVAFMRGSLVLSGPKGLVLQRLFEVLPDTVAVNVEFTAEEACDQ